MMSSLRAVFFYALFKLVLTYGEIWGQGALCRGHSFTDSSFSMDLENLYKSFLTRSLGLRKSISDVVLMIELRRNPLIIIFLLSL
jgi:hypothetical protein